jgi:hypothetical protein
MHKDILSKSILTVAICGLASACGAAGETDTSREMAELDEKGAEVGEEAARDEAGVQHFTGLGEQSEDAAWNQAFTSREMRSPDPAHPPMLLSTGLDGDDTSSVVVTNNTWISVYRGGTGGGNYTLSCLPGEIAIGIYGRSGGYIDQLGLICAYVYPDGSFGPEDWRGWAGGNGGGFFISKCPAGHGIAGFSGRSGSFIDQLRLVCDTIPGTSLYYGPVFGGGGGGPWTDISPYRHFLTTIMGRSGVFIDSLQQVHKYVAP